MAESEVLRRIRTLVAEGQFLVSDHGYDELAADRIFVKDLVTSLPNAIVVENYPRANRGASVLVLHRDSGGRPIHVVWGIPKGFDAPAVLVTAYRPDPDRWSREFMRRRER